MGQDPRLSVACLSVLGWALAGPADAVVPVTTQQLPVESQREMVDQVQPRLQGRRAVGYSASADGKPDAQTHGEDGSACSA